EHAPQGQQHTKPTPPGNDSEFRLVVPAGEYPPGEQQHAAHAPGDQHGGKRGEVGQVVAHQRPGSALDSDGEGRPFLPMTPPGPELSIVVPTFNEAGNVAVV